MDEDVRKLNGNKTNGAPLMYVLRMYITGASPNSAKAISNIKLICDEYIPGIYDLEIIDVYQEPLMAQKEQIIALPMLIKLSPLPFKRLIGDMSDTKKIITALGL